MCHDVVVKVGRVLCCVVKGFTRTAKGLLDLGLIDPNPNPLLHPSGPDITWVCCTEIHLQHDYVDCFWRQNVEKSLFVHPSVYTKLLSIKVT